MRVLASLLVPLLLGAWVLGWSGGAYGEQVRVGEAAQSLSENGQWRVTVLPLGDGSMSAYHVAERRKDGDTTHWVQVSRTEGPHPLTVHALSDGGFLMVGDHAQALGSGTQEVRVFEKDGSLRWRKAPRQWFDATVWASLPRRASAVSWRLSHWVDSPRGIVTFRSGNGAARMHLVVVRLRDGAPVDDEAVGVLSGLCRAPHMDRGALAERALELELPGAAPLAEVFFVESGLSDRQRLPYAVLIADKNPDAAALLSRHAREGAPGLDRAFAMRHLARSEGPRARAHQLAVMQAGTEGLVRPASRALAVLGEDGFALLRRLVLDSTVPTTSREIALDALATAGAPRNEVLSVLVRCVTNPNYRFQRSAVVALAQFARGSRLTALHVVLLGLDSGVGEALGARLVEDPARDAAKPLLGALAAERKRAREGRVLKVALERCKGAPALPASDVAWATRLVDEARKADGR